MSEHICEVPGCSTPTRPYDLMCRTHWYKVPAPIRRAVLHSWQYGNATQHAAAKKAAIEAVERQEASL